MHYTLPSTDIAPANWWLEDKCSFWDGLFSGANPYFLGVYALYNLLIYFASTLDMLMDPINFAANCETGKSEQAILD